MKTSELIDVLASTRSGPGKGPSPAVRIAGAGLAGGMLALFALVAWLGVQPLDRAVDQSWFWMKGGYALAAAIAGLAMTISLSRPGGRVSRLGSWLAVGAMCAIGLMAFHSASSAGWAAEPGLWLGRTWKVCPWRILALAAPIWLAAAVALRRLAPTRLALAGAAAGLMAGGLAALVYGLYCQESAAPFVAVWYSLGIAASAGLGALLGPRFLRW